MTFPEKEQTRKAPQDAERPSKVPSLDWHYPFAPPGGFTAKRNTDGSVSFVPMGPKQTKPAPEAPRDNTR